MGAIGVRVVPPAGEVEGPLEERIAWSDLVRREKTAVLVYALAFALCIGVCGAVLVSAIVL